MQDIGPVLYFRGVGDGAWNLSALVTRPTDRVPEALVAGELRVSPQPLDRRKGRTLWRYDFSLPYGDRTCRHEYRIGERNWHVSVPAAGGPLRIAFTACNGSESGNAWKRSEERNPLWTDLAAQHAERPFSLLVQGGDQLYADPVWRDVPQLVEWRRMPTAKRLRAPFTSDMADAVRDYYFDQYCGVWGQAELAPVLAEIPSLMMWDDHDIIDGWGSYPQTWHDSDVLQGIWSGAREHFALFQLGARPDDLPEGFSDRQGGHFGWAYRIGDIGIVAPDLRSERSRSRVLGEAGHRGLSAALDSMAGCRHVLLVSTVPLVNARLHLLERFFRWLPGHQTWQDDLIDQWPSAAHWDEWSALLRELTDFSTRTGATLSVLSGEIHLGALGVIESPTTQIYQLTSSGIVHPPPSAAVTTAFELASLRTIQVAPDLSAKVLPMPGSGIGRRYLRKRNWLALDVSAKDGLAATWYGDDNLARTFAISPSGTPAFR